MRDKLYLIRALSHETNHLVDYRGVAHAGVVKRLCDSEKHQTYNTIKTAIDIMLPYAALNDVDAIHVYMRKNYSHIQLYPLGIYYIAEFNHEYLVYGNIENYIGTEVLYIPTYSSYLSLARLSHFNLDIEVDHRANTV